MSLLDPCLISSKKYQLPRRLLVFNSIWTIYDWEMWDVGRVVDQRQMEILVFV